MKFVMVCVYTTNMYLRNTGVLKYVMTASFHIPYFLFHLPAIWHYVTYRNNVIMYIKKK
jgi:hypothetical protein